MFYNHNKKQILAVLAASLLLTFSGGICAFADEGANGNTSSVSDLELSAAADSSADTSSDTSVTTEEITENEIEKTTENGIKETAKNEAENNSAGDSDEEITSDSDETSTVILAGNSKRKAQTETESTQTDTEDTTKNENDENSGDTSADHSANGSDNGMVSLGIFRTTAYCPCYACSEGYGRHTCTGATARSSHTIAVDPRVIPFGSKVLINGVVYTAEDRGGAVRGNHIDIFFDTHAQTWQYGTRAAEVFLLA